MILFDYDKAAYLMGQWGVDMLLPHSLLNAGYLADHWKHDLHTSIAAYTTLDVDEFYQLFVGLPRDRKIEPFVTCRRGSEEGDMYNWGMWIEDRRIWGPELPDRSANTPLAPVTTLYPDPYEAVAAVLRERGLEAASIGVEMRFLAVEAHRRLSQLLPDARFREVLPLFLELREVKCEEEIRRMRMAAQATQNSLGNAIAALRPGMTGLELQRLVGAGHYRAGARHEWMHTQMGPLGIDVVGPNPGEARLGEMIRIDAGASYRHYQSDMSPVIAIGEPSGDLLTIHRNMRRAMDAVLEALRPGIPVAQLFAYGNAVMSEARLGSFLTYLGHGLGRNVHEDPVLSSRSERSLEPGMAMAIELITNQPEIGMIGIEDDVVITADGHEDLSTIGRELHVVAA